MMIGFVFPGQGSQTPGMGRELYDNLQAARMLLDEANEILGYDLKSLMFEGPIEQLSDTRYAQPAIFTCSAMYLAKAHEDGLVCDYVAGHSLGEYDALLAAGVFDFADGLRLVARRGELMARMNGRGTMAAVLGLAESELAEIMEGIPDVVMANLNSRNQIVVSGAEEGVTALGERLANLESVKFRKLRVSAAFHSPQMAEAADAMREVIAAATFSEPSCCVVPNVTGVPTRNVDEIRRCLVSQITGQVRWMDSVLAMKTAGVKTLYEVGHGDVLKKLSKTIAFRPKCLGIEV